MSGLGVGIKVDLFEKDLSQKVSQCCRLYKYVGTLCYERQEASNALQEQTTTQTKYFWLPNSQYLQQDDL